MAIGTGLSAQLMVKAESTYGTPITPDRAYEIMTEGIATNFGRYYSAGLGRGAFHRVDRMKAFPLGAEGSVEMDVLNKNFGLLFEHAIGQNTVTGTTVRTHTIIPSTNGLAGKSLTVQVGKPGVGGVVRPFTYEGGKVKTWELKCDVLQALKLNLDFDFENVLTATSLATPSYVASQEPYIFTEGAVTIDGTTVYTKSMSVRGDNKLATDRRFLGNTKKEPLQADIVDVTGALDLEWDDFTYYSSALTGAVVPIVITFTLATEVTTGTPFSLTITLPKCEFTEAKPTVGGPGIVPLSLPFKALYDGTNPVVTIAYITTDTAS